MKTLIFDINGTLTDMQPVEDVRLRALNNNPTLKAYKVVEFIKANANNYHFVYATGGTSANAEYVLRNLGIWDIFDVPNSVSASTSPYPKTTGEPFLEIKEKFPDCIAIGDSNIDFIGASKADVPFVLLETDQPLTTEMLDAAVLGQGQ